jgi:hypothetical protein
MKNLSLLNERQANAASVTFTVISLIHCAERRLFPKLTQPWRARPKLLTDIKAAL